VRIVGGGFGTTPNYIAAVKKAVAGISCAEPTRSRYTAATSGTKTTLFRGVTLIGERINPTGKTAMREALRERDTAYITGEAVRQTEAGCGVLNVNAALPDTDEAELLAYAVQEIQAVCSTPLMIDSADPAAIEQAARVYNGKPIINSVNGKAESLYNILPIAKKYGALVVAMTLNEDGVPGSAEGRLAVAKKMIVMAECEGIPREDILIDCVARAASARQEQAMETLRAIRLVKAELGVKTILGVSNVSRGLSAREALNAAYLAAALGAGLDAPILNPLSAKNQELTDCFRVFTGDDKGAARFAEAYGKG
jgi:5-methyltetrahydrofolate--homocysteine methyltransferase